MMSHQEPHDRGGAPHKSAPNVGVHSIAELRVGGMDRDAITDALARGALTRITRGWFATPGASTDAVQAIKAGGRLGCLSGCSAHGLWTPEHLSAHIILPARAKGRGMRGHRHVGRLPNSVVFPLEDCLRQVVRAHDAETALMVLESALNLDLIKPYEASSLAEHGQADKQVVLGFLDKGAGSGSETRVRAFLRQLRVKVRSQVAIDGVGRVDLLVGQSLIIECDSKAHHSDPTIDRQRDLAARERGYAVVRLSYEQIFLHWEETQEMLVRILRTRQHRRPPPPLPPIGPPRSRKQLPAPGTSPRHAP